MGGFESLRDLPRDRKRRSDRDRPAGDVRGEVFALDQLHHQCNRRDGIGRRGGGEKPIENPE